MSHDDRSSDPTSPERSAADDDAWLAGLAGRAVERDDAAHIDDTREATREAGLMRAALRRWTPSVDAVSDRDPERIAKLIGRARAEGLFDDRIAATGARRAPPKGQGPFDRLRAWWRSDASPSPAPRRAWAMAVAVGAVVALAYVIRPANERAIDDENVVRSAPDAVTLLRARDPEALQREIVDALRQQGVRATTYSRFGRLGLDADLPPPLSRDVKAVLDRYRIPPPVDGALRVEIEAERR